MTTTIVYPAAGTGGGTTDGHTRRGGVSELWSTIRAGNGTAHSDTTANENCAQLSADTVTDKYTAMRRSIYTLDTTAVPATDEISSVTFSVYGVAKTNGFSTSPELDVVSAAPATVDDLVNADFTTLGASPYGSIAYASFSTSAYNDISLSTTAVTAAGITRLGVRTSWDTDNSAPTWTSGAVASFQTYFADQTGTTNDPKLTVIHAATDTRVFIIS